jgi:ribosomal protein L37AE/L43A
MGHERARAYERAQARCPKCNTRHTWPKRLGPPVAGAMCPDCGETMARTTHLVRMPVKDWPHGLGATMSERAA